MLISQEDSELLMIVRRFVALCRAHEAPSSPDPGVTHLLTLVLQEIRIMSGNIDSLTNRITNMESVGDGMAALLADLSARVREAANDTTKMAAIGSEIDTHTAAWVAAVTANTPVASEPAPVVNSAASEPNQPAPVPTPEPVVPDAAANTTAEPAPAPVAAPAETTAAAPTGTEMPL